MTQSYQLVAATGASGARYDFQAFPWGTEFQAVPGLYAFCYPGAQSDWTAIYVGQSHDLQARVGVGIGSHHKASAALNAGATHVCVHGFQGREADRIAAELDLISGLKPPLNETGLGMIGRGFGFGRG